MMCYRDMTFCPFWESCEDGDDCARALDDYIKVSAKNAGLPISQFLAKPECHKEES